MSKITFDDKTNLTTDPSIARTNKVIDDDINEIKSVVNENAVKQVLTGHIVTDIAMPTNANYSNISLVELTKNGNKLSIGAGTYGNGIKIGNGIKKVLISGSAAVNNTSDTNLYYVFYLYKNDEIIFSSRIHTQSGQAQSLYIPQLSLSATENDIIGARVYKNNSTKSSTIQSTHNRTFLTVEGLTDE